MEKFLLPVAFLLCEQYQLLVKVRRVRTQECWQFMLPCFEICLPDLLTKAAVKAQPMFLFPCHHSLVLYRGSCKHFLFVFGVLRGPVLNPCGVWCDRGWSSILTTSSTAVVDSDGAQQSRWSFVGHCPLVVPSSLKAMYGLNEWPEMNYVCLSTCMEVPKSEPSIPDLSSMTKDRQGPHGMIQCWVPCVFPLINCMGT